MEVVWRSVHVHRTDSKNPEIQSAEAILTTEGPSGDDRNKSEAATPTTTELEGHRPQQ